MHRGQIEAELLALGYKKVDRDNFRNKEGFYAAIEYLGDGYWNCLYEHRGFTYRIAVSPYNENINSLLKGFLLNNRIW